MAVLVAVIVSALLITHSSPAPPLSLVFEGYGTVKTMDPLTMDLSVQDVAFLWITNSGDKAYYVAQAGGTNTSVPDAPRGLKQSWTESSYMPRCEFSDQPPAGSAPPPVSFASLGLCVPVEPHSAVRLRVPLPTESQKRKVAVICIEEAPSPRPFWTSRVGGTVIRVLPRAVAIRAMLREPTMLRIRCDRELSPGREKLEKR
jgi:hypothetical protein